MAVAKTEPVVKASRDSKDPRNGKYARYLAMYNQYSASLWTIVFFNTILLNAMLGQPQVFFVSKNITTGIQTLAVAEIFHSALGFVKSPLLTTVSQVASRLLVVWGIFIVLPNSPANYHWAYSTVQLAWSVTEIIRYFYYAQNITTGGHPPRILTKLRYNLFFILYPSGVASELTLMYLSLDEAERVVGVWYRYLFYAVFVIYIPGFYILFTHMIKQRKRALRALKEEEEAESKLKAK
jgi:very-long-chain (3R)-3-hydroxyacyl-CoA dehydratase